MELKHESITLSSLVRRALHPTCSILICFSREGGGVLAPSFLRSLYRRVQGILRSLLCLTSPRPRPTSPRVPYLMFSSPSSRVPKSQVPMHTCPKSPSHFHTQLKNTADPHWFVAVVLPSQVFLYQQATQECFLRIIIDRKK